MSMAPPPHEGPATGEPAPAFQQKLGLFDATMLVAGTMIGSGIFIVSADIARDVGSSGWLMLVWVLTGVITLLGALSYAELAAMMPHAGGQYVYLREAFSPLWGFLYGWTLFLVIQTGSIAAVAVAFAKFLGVFVPQLGTGEEAVLFRISGLHISLDLPLPWLEQPLNVFQRHEFTMTGGQLVAVGIIALLTLLNCRGVQEGKWVQNLFTVAKTLALILLIVMGLSIAADPAAIEKNLANLWEGAVSTVRYQQVSELVDLPRLAVVLMVVGGAMVGALFAADAWNNVTFTAGEVRNPRRNLAWSLVLGVGLVITLYILANLAYLAALPVQADPELEARLRALDQEIKALEDAKKLDQAAAASERRDALVQEASAFDRGVARAKDDRVGTAVVERASPALGVPFIAIAVMISTFGCVNGMILMGARLYYAMARDRLFFRAVGGLNPRGVPAAGLILQGVWSALLVFSGTYSELLDYVIFAALFFYVLTVVGLFVLRWRQPHAHRPYRAWGYPILPAIYVLLCAAIMFDLLIVRPTYTWPGLLIVLTGIPVYFAWRVGGWVRRAE